MMRVLCRAQQQQPLVHVVSWNSVVAEVICKVPFWPQVDAGKWLIRRLRKAGMEVCSELTLIYQLPHRALCIT